MIATDASDGRGLDGSSMESERNTPVSRATVPHNTPLLCSGGVTENLRVTIEEGDGRWGPPYPGMYDSDFWKRPAFQHWRVMLERGRPFPHPGSQSPASSEVIATSVISRMMHRVLIEKWEAERAVEEAHGKVVEIYDRHHRRG